MSTPIADIQQAFRRIRRNPRAAAVMATCFALGIGANALLFGAVDLQLLEAPPGVNEPASLWRVYVTASSRYRSNFTRDEVTIREYRHLLIGLDHLGTSAAYWVTRADIGRGIGLEPVRVAVATHAFFSVVGVRPLLGAFPSVADDSSGASRVAVISYGLWQRRYAGKYSVIGQSFIVDGATYSIMGVAPKQFAGVDIDPVDIWLPLGSGGPDLFERDALTSPNTWLTVLVRRNRSVTSSAVEASLTLVMQRLYPQPGLNEEVKLGPLQVARGPLVDPNTQVLLWASGVSLLVLLIACANVANLLWARAFSRQREMAIRVALGAPRREVLRQFVIEGIALSVLGAIPAAVLALTAGPRIQTWLTPVGSTVQGSSHGRLLLAVLLLAIAGGAGSALLPGIRLARNSVVQNLGDRGNNRWSSHSVVMRILTVSQVALTVTLLFLAGLLVTSLRNVLRIDLGLDPNNVYSVSLETPGAPFTPGRSLATYLDLVREVKSRPEVRSAAISIGSPFESAIAANVVVAGQPFHMGPAQDFLSIVTPGFFQTMGMTIVHGRGFLDSDIEGSPSVAVINEMLARKLWPGRDPLGQCLQLRGGPACVSVVGVTRDGPFLSVVAAPKPFLYLPLAQAPINSPTVSMEVLARGGQTGDVPVLLRRLIVEANPNLPYVAITPFADRIDKQLRPWRLGSALFLGYGGLAMVLTAFGLYGFLAYSIKQRSREIGIRMALGSPFGALVGMVVGDALTWVLIGLLLGACISFAAGRVVRALLYGIAPYDPRVFGFVAVALVLVALIASAVPARRATLIDPLETLRAQ